MNSKEIVFIICVNNELLFEECLYYINRLQVPEGYAIDVIAIREADSMCAGYNAAMQNSDAKYKIYLHQDVFIRNTEFLFELLQIFENDASVGMLGMLGGVNMPKTGVTYRAWNAGAVDCRDPDMSYYLLYDMKDNENAIVEAVDGILIATQYDIPWREDLFHHFDFYDISQSFEMRKAGYKIVVPYQEVPWVVHDSNFVKLPHYDEGRQICLKEYPEFLYADGGKEFIYNKEWNLLSDELTAMVKQMLVRGEWEQVAEIISIYRSKQMRSTELEVIGIMLEIYQKEIKNNVRTGFFDGLTSWDEMYEKYMYVRFLLRRMEFNLSEHEYEDLINAMKADVISYDALLTILFYGGVDRKICLRKWIEIYKSSGQLENAIKAEQVYEQVKRKPLQTCTY